MTQTGVNYTFWPLVIERNGDYRQSSYCKSALDLRMEYRRIKAATEVAGATSRINVSQLYSAKKVDGKTQSQSPSGN